VLLLNTYKYDCWIYSCVINSMVLLLNIYKYDCWIYLLGGHGVGWKRTQIHAPYLQSDTRTSGIGMGILVESTKTPTHMCQRGSGSGCGWECDFASSFCCIYIYTYIHIYICIYTYICAWHMNWVSFDFNVCYSSCWGYSLINTLKLKKKS